MITVSIAAAATQTAPMATAPSPSWSSASGASTFSVPKKSAGTVISQSPSRKSRSRIAATTNPSGWRSAGDGSRRSAGHQEHDLEGRDGGERPADADHARGRADHRAEQRAEDGGAHRRAHRLAATLARGGERQPGEPARPGQRRAEALGEPRRDERPVTPGGGDTDTARGDEDEPREDGAPRAAARGDDAAGIAPARTPRPYAATSAPTPPLERWYVSSKWGSSGVSAVYSAVSTTTTTQTKGSSRRIVRGYRGGAGRCRAPTVGGPGRLSIATTRL